MGSAKSIYFEIERPELPPSFTSSHRPVRSFTERQQLLASIQSSLEMLRWEVSDISGAIDSLSGDYSPACNVVLDRVAAIELQIKRL